MTYIARKAKVKDMRDVRKQIKEGEEDDIPYMLAERCITKENGQKITMDELNDMDLDEFTRLIGQINPKNA